MRERINEASKETNEDNTASESAGNQQKKQKQTTDLRDESNKRKKDEKSKRILLKPLLNNWRKLMNKLRKTKSPAARGLQQSGGREACARRRERERLN